MERIAIDIGGVILDIHNNSDESLLMLNTIDYLNKLKNKYDLYLLSFCGKKTEQETRTVLKNIHNIDSIIDESKWIFVRKTKNKKVEMINHNIKLLIDDRKSIIDDVISNNLLGVLFTNWNDELLNTVDNEMNRLNRLNARND